MIRFCCIKISLMRNNQVEFILAPLANIIEEAVAALKGIPNGMASFPVSEYFLQSLFLRLTGAQEQKCKCICWELATYDFEYRRRRFNSREMLGECSCGEEKRKVVLDVRDAVAKIAGEDVANGCFDKVRIKHDATAVVDVFHRAIEKMGWDERGYVQYVSVFLRRDDYCSFVDSGKGRFLFVKCDNCAVNGKKDGKGHCALESLNDIYDNCVTMHRNRCAHNTASRLKYASSLCELRKGRCVEDNYFVRFHLVLMVDMLMTALFKEWLSWREQS